MLCLGKGTNVSSPIETNVSRATVPISAYRRYASTLRASVFSIGLTIERTCKDLRGWELGPTPQLYNDRPPMDLRAYTRYDCVSE